MKHTRIILIMILALALTSVLPVMSQDETTTVEYTFNGTELQRIENGVIVQVWTLTNTLETQQIVGILNAQARSTDPTINYAFDNDRMYHLRGDQVVGLSELRGGSWVEEPALIVRYEYDGQDMRRFVNDRVQEEWALPPGVQTYGFMTMMQAQANELVAMHVSEELYAEQPIEHLPTLLADKFTLHYTPSDQSIDMTWYTPEFADSLASVLSANTTDPVVMAMEDLVVLHEPVITEPRYDLMNMPQFSYEPPANLYDLYRFEDGKLTEMWLGFDLATLTQTAN